MSQKYEKLKALLKELFQLDQPDLDFGLYRIMHAKSAEVSQFLDRDLLPQVQAAFGHYKTAEKAEIEKDLAKVIAGIEAAGMDPAQSPKVNDLRARLKSDAVDVGALESEVYDRLFSFFRRYYSEGDFLAKRVYKPGVYAIPYEGEEVTLHWANKDQYYIKTSEYLRDYAFRLRPEDPSTGSGQAQKPMRVHFRLADAAEGEHGNVKAAEGKDRVFILATENFIALKTPSPLAGEGGGEGDELEIRFEYRPATLTDWAEETRAGKSKPPAQKDLSALAAKRILSYSPSPLAGEGRGEGTSLAPWITELGKPHITASGEKADTTRLEAHLRRYTARNTFDYFIHKDLGTFLRRELDFYIKNEVMHLDDVENESVPRVEQYLSKIKVIRKIAGKIITFLAQLEDFQKKLWLKKKFVVETQWCITLGCVPEAFYPEIAANDAQWEEWKKLGFTADITGNAGILPANTPSANLELFPTLHKGWHSRGYLPHFDAEKTIQAISFRLHDSVPAATIAQWKEELHWNENTAPGTQEAITLRKKIEQYEDSGKGACHLRNDAIGALVRDALKHFDQERYTLIAWCVMPNHVHVLIETKPGHPLSEVIQTWKSFTAKEANKHLNRKGAFWMPDYFDRYIRDEQHYRAAIEYIVQNPVKAGLVDEPAQWPWAGVIDMLDCGRDARAPGIEFLKLNPTLVVDTRHFDEGFTARLLEAMGDVDGHMDGMLFHSENFQALSLMQTRYRERVKCIYIDPPYNTGEDDFPYKDSYQHSSWMSMMLDRALLASTLLASDGLLSVQIGDEEMAHLRVLFDEIFAERKNTACVRRGIKNVQAQFIDIDRLSLGHDVVHSYAKHAGVRLAHLRQALKDEKPGKWDTFWRGTDRHTMRYELFGKTPETGQWRWEEGRSRRAIQAYEHYLRLESVTKKLDEWYAENLQCGVDLDFVRLNDEGVVQYYVPPQNFRLVSDNWLDIPASGNLTEFAHEKSLPLLQRVISWSTHPGDYVLDYFGGSGSTGHAAFAMPPAGEGGPSSSSSKWATTSTRYCCRASRRSRSRPNGRTASRSVSPRPRKPNAVRASSRSCVSNPTKTRSTTWRPAVPTPSNSCSTPPRHRARTVSGSSTFCAICSMSRRAAASRCSTCRPSPTPRPTSSRSSGRARTRAAR